MQALAPNEDSDPFPPSLTPDAAPSLGPVASLNEHVPTDWWRDLFGPTYLMTDADIMTDAITADEVTLFIRHARLTPSDRILDLCCGQGRHTLELARRGFRHVQGLDQSAFLIEQARATAAYRGLHVPFGVGDARALPFADASFDAVLLLGNSFGYFDAAADDLAVLREVHRVLRPTGRVLLDLTDGAYTRTHFDARSWEWMDDDFLVCRERELSPDGQRLLAREIIIHVERGVQKDQFYAERLYSRADLCVLLAEAGFAPPQFAPLQGQSTRNQDLGMMAQRHIITAHPLSPGDGLVAPDAVLRPRGTPADATPADEAGGVPVLHVAVVMGDPSLPDETKLDHVFDADDFETVNRLKDALGTLDGFSFTYLNHHATLLDDLRACAPATDLVLNLCDEGWGNNPRHELHVPAVLDVLNLPYTGAPPQALACCFDKSLVRGVAHELGIRTAPGLYLPPTAPVPATLPLAFPVIVKPNAADNSAGMTQRCIAHNAEELEAAIASVRSYIGTSHALLIEQFLPGQDLTLGLIGNPEDGFHTLPISEDDYSALPEGLPPFCGYEAKWIPDSPYWQQIQAVPAVLPEATAAAIRRDSQRLFERLGCRDYARFDWRLDAEGRPCLLEANPNPGWCWDGHLTVAAAYEGRTYPDVLRMVLEAALRRTAPTLHAPR